MSWVWFLSFLVFAAAIWLGEWRPLGLSFQLACFASAFVGLGLSASGAVSDGHLLWYTPLTIAVAFRIRLRGFFKLKARLDRIAAGNFTDVDDLRRQVEREINAYDQSVSEDQRLDRSHKPGAPTPSDDGPLRFFTPIATIEPTMREHSPDERKRLKTEFFRHCIAEYRKEVQWKRHCKPHFLVMCLIPILWPFLYGRSVMSRQAQRMMRDYLEELRNRWRGDLEDVARELDDDSATSEN